MAENKTKATGASVQDYLAAIEPEAKRRDCEAIAALMAKITKCEPKMWGPGIVGFDSVHYKYDSGREGDMSATGFASRKNEIVVYLAADGANQAALLARLGRHKMGKCCLYIRRLADLDQELLAQLIAGSVKEVKRRYGG
jgi:hypothetical protein